MDSQLEQAYRKQLQMQLKPSSSDSDDKMSQQEPEPSDLLSDSDLLGSESED